MTAECHGVLTADTAFPQSTIGIQFRLQSGIVGFFVWRGYAMNENQCCEAKHQFPKHHCSKLETDFDEKRHSQHGENKEIAARTVFGIWKVKSDVTLN